jgi:hypothetical protein
MLKVKLGNAQQMQNLDDATTCTLSLGKNSNNG